MTLITAILDEWHQAFDPSRTSSGWDVALDVTGGAVFLSLAVFVLKFWREIPKELRQPGRSAELVSPRA
jgi:VanZ family protein